MGKAAMNRSSTTAATIRMTFLAVLVSVWIAPGIEAARIQDEESRSEEARRVEDRPQEPQAEGTREAHIVSPGQIMGKASR